MVAYAARGSVAIADKVARQPDIADTLDPEALLLG
jgi:hypothetical protein